MALYLKIECECDNCLTSKAEGKIEIPHNGADPPAWDKFELPDGWRWKVEGWSEPFSAFTPSHYSDRRMWCYQCVENELAY